MSGAQPVNHRTGERGPVFPSATEAALWIVARDDFRAWRWELVDLEDKPRRVYCVLRPTAADCAAFAAVESPAVSPTLDR